MRVTPNIALARYPEQTQQARDLARRYIAGLFESEPQAMMQKHYMRSPLFPQPHALPDLSEVQLRSIEDVGGWPAMHAEHFADGASFDVLSRKRRQ